LAAALPPFAVLPAPCPTLVPYTTLFRSLCEQDHRDLELLRQRENTGGHRRELVVRGLSSGLDAADELRVVDNDQSELRPVFVLQDRKSTRLNSSHVKISYAVFCLKKKNK